MRAQPPGDSGWWRPASLFALMERWPIASGLTIAVVFGVIAAISTGSIGFGVFLASLSIVRSGLARVPALAGSGVLFIALSLAECVGTFLLTTSTLWRLFGVLMVAIAIWGTLASWRWRNRPGPSPSP